MKQQLILLMMLTACGTNDKLVPVIATSIVPEPDQTNNKVYQYITTCPDDDINTPCISYRVEVTK
jgi:hypothetical protein